MVLGVRVEPELERQLDQLALQLGKTRSACIREAISLYLSRHGDAAEACRQSQHLAQVEPNHWSEQLPDWSDWTAGQQSFCAAVRWLQAHPSVTLCPLTSTLRQAPLVRIAVEPSGRNGLRKPSQLMVDKLFTVPAVAVAEVVGQLEPQVLVDLDLALRSWLELPGWLLRLMGWSRLG